MSVFPRHIVDLAAQVLEKARAKGVKIATAESCTGGLVAAALTEIPGSSDVFEGGFVTYSYEAKTELLGVEARMLAKHGAVSEDVARAMAEGALKHASAQAAIAITGVAGPGSSENKPAGLVHFAAARRDGTTLHEEHRFGDIGRNEVRTRSVAVALNLLLRLF